MTEASVTALLIRRHVHIHAHILIDIYINMNKNIYYVICGKKKTARNAK